MRVIAGKYRGIKLVSPPNMDVRPTVDRIKEAVFSSIQFRVNGSVFVDLFSGSGSIGIEAISRGAKKVFLVDNSTDSINIVRKNLEKIKVDSNIAEIKNCDYKLFLSSTKGIDIVYVDPPYNRGEIYTSILSLLYDKLNEDGIVILERNEPIDICCEGYELIFNRTYGKIFINIYKKI